MLKRKSKGPPQTKKLAARLAKRILHSQKLVRSAKVIALSGNLGVGKTVFIQGFLKALGVKQRITSPTFVIFKPYALNAKPYSLAYHVDCYRIHQPKDIIALGFKKIIQNNQNIILIEWAERIKRILPPDTLWIKLGHGKKENERIIKIAKS